MSDECVESVKNDERLLADNKSEAVSRFNARNVIAVDFGPLPGSARPKLTGLGTEGLRPRCPGLNCPGRNLEVEYCAE